MCYNVALPQIWSDICKIKSIKNIKDRLIQRYQQIYYIEGHGKSRWSTDQIDLYKSVMDWNTKTHNFICLKEKHTDYHCYRPFKKYENINNKIYELL